MEIKLSFICDMIHGMEYLHHHTSIGSHGYLKSSNVLVTGCLTAKIADFGTLCRLFWFPMFFEIRYDVLMAWQVTKSVEEVFHLKYHTKIPATANLAVKQHFMALGLVTQKSWRSLVKVQLTSTPCGQPRRYWESRFSNLFSVRSWFYLVN